MPVRAAIVGSKLQPSMAVIAARDLLAYAAGIGATDRVWFDDARPGGIVGFPVYSVTLEWPVVRTRAGDDAFGLTREEALRGVHASLDSTYHRPIRPGDRLRSEGVIAAVRATRAGAFVAQRVTTVEDATGDRVVTSWYGSIFRGVAVEGADAALAEPPALEPVTAAPAETIEIPVAREAPHIYAECAEIWNPIHTERAVALAAGLPDIILHGTATFALAGREILRRCAGGESARLRRLGGRFGAMVIPGSAIRVELGRASAGRVPFVVKNAAGELAISHGLAELE